MDLNMIIDYTTDNNAYKKNILYYKGKLEWECPICDAKHSLHRHGTYDRNLILLCNNSLKEIALTIQRVKCSACNHTHAILPWDVVPFGLYSLTAVLDICVNIYKENKPILSLTRQFQISYQLLYRFLQIVQSVVRQMCILLQYVNPKENFDHTTTGYIVNAICNTMKLPDFLRAYHRRYRTPLLLNRCSTVSYNLTFGCK